MPPPAATLTSCALSSGASSTAPQKIASTTPATSDEPFLARAGHRVGERLARVVGGLPAELLARLAGVHHDRYAERVDPRQLGRRKWDTPDHVGGHLERHVRDRKRV